MTRSLILAAITFVVFVFAGDPVDAQVFRNRTVWRSGVMRSSCPGGVCPVPSASQGYHQHVQFDGTILTHGDWNFGNAAAHATVPRPWIKWHGPEQPIRSAAKAVAVPAVNAARVVAAAVTPDPVVVSNWYVAPTTASVVVTDSITSTAVEALVAGDRPFVKTCRDATAAARAAGKISLLQQARIMAAARLSRVGPEIEQLAAAEMGMEVSATGLIDWENFDPEKFMVLIEAILKILLTFGIGG